jgi:ABC-type tungstate transport system permease subunit
MCNVTQNDKGIEFISDQVITHVMQRNWWHGKSKQSEFQGNYDMLGKGASREIHHLYNSVLT